MSNAIGRMIGVVAHSFKVTNDKGAEVQLSVSIDFSTASDQDLKNWLVSNRIIAGQRPWRSLSQAELLNLQGQTFMAQDIGRKVKSRSDQIGAFKAAFMSAGIDEDKAQELAEAAVDNPSALTIADKDEDENE